MGLGLGYPSFEICPKLDQISPINKANLVLVDFNKNLGFGQTPPNPLIYPLPPLLGQNPKFC